jgi:beta-phosphoglucomutase-like phosphatase (HAD superfamily)
VRRRGLEVDVPDLMRRVNGRNGRECMLELFQRDLDAQACEELVNEKEQIYRDLFGPSFAEVAGAREFAERTVNQGLRFGVGSAGDRHNLAFALKHLALTHAPQAVVGGDEGLAGKPDPAIFLEAARRLQVEPAECIVFEDAPFGIEAARRAGMRAVAICSSHSPQELSGPHVLTHARDYNELLQSRFLEILDVATA